MNIKGAEKTVPDGKIRQQRPQAAGLLLRVEGRVSRRARRLAHAPDLADDEAGHLLVGLCAELGAHGCRAHHGLPHVPELLLDRRVLGNGQVDGRHGEEGGDLQRLDVLDKRAKLKLGHPVRRRAAHHLRRKVVDDAGNVRRGQVRERALRPRGLRVPVLPVLAAREENLGYHVFVRHEHACHDCLD